MEEMPAIIEILDAEETRDYYNNYVEETNRWPKETKNKILFACLLCQFVAGMCTNNLVAFLPTFVKSKNESLHNTFALRQTEVAFIIAIFSLA